MTTHSVDLTTTQALRRTIQEVPIIARRAWFIVLLNVGGTAVQLLIPVIVQQSIDRYFGSGTDVAMDSILTAVGIGLVLVVVGGLMTRAGLVRLIRQAEIGLSDLRVGVFDHLMRRSVLHVQTERRGALVSRVTSDITTVQEFMSWGGISFLVNGTQVIGALGVMFVYDWRLATIVLLGIVIYAIILRWFQQILRRRYDTVRQRVADSLAVMGEAITALPAVRAYAAESTTMRRVDDALEDRFQIEFKTAHFGNMLFATAEVFAATLTIVVITVGLLLGPDQGISAGELLAFLFLVNLLVAPIQNMVEILDFAQSAASGLRRIVDSLDAPVEIPEPDHPIDLPPDSLDVAFEHVGFSYPGGSEVLSDVSCHIDAGSRVAIVGETGSGKTTFAKILVRLLDPGTGTVRMGGVDLRSVRMASLRSRVAFVPQEGFLFTGTVGENVRYGRPDATDDVLRNAFSELHLDEWLEQLGGLHGSVGERGSSLSAGERQLVALVRAWVAGAELLVLDEATSAVDPALDVHLRDAMDRLIAGRTSITIAHRLATAEAADEVLVFDAGRLVERGHHDALLEAGGRYASLYADWAAGTAVV